MSYCKFASAIGTNFRHIHTGKTWDWLIFRVPGLEGVFEELDDFGQPADLPLDAAIFKYRTAHHQLNGSIMPRHSKDHMNDRTFASTLDYRTFHPHGEICLGLFARQVHLVYGSVSNLVKELVSASSKKLRLEEYLAVCLNLFGSGILERTSVFSFVSDALGLASSAQHAFVIARHLGRMFQPPKSVAECEVELDDLRRAAMEKERMKQDVWAAQQEKERRAAEAKAKLAAKAARMAGGGGGSRGGVGSSGGRGRKGGRKIICVVSHLCCRVIIWISSQCLLELLRGHFLWH